MDLPQAINKLKFTHLERNKPDDRDRIALNKVIIELNYARAIAFESSQGTLLKKCITQLFLNDLRRTRGSYEIAVGNLESTLKVSLDGKYSQFQSEVFAIEWSKFTKSIGVTNEVTDEAADSKLIDDNAKELEKIINHYTLEKITKRLEEMSKELITKYSDYE